LASEHVLSDVRRLLRFPKWTLLSLITSAAAAVPYTAGQAQANAASGAEPLRAQANVDRGGPLRDNATIELSLNRPLAPDEGDLALIVGGVDVTAVSERTPSRIVYRPTAVALPAGQTELVLFSHAGGRWNEIKRVSLKVLQAASPSQFSAEKLATVGNKGQIAEGRSPSVPIPDRRTFQDFVLNAGLRSSQQQVGWALTTQSNYVGVTRRQEALQFGAQGEKAPMLDLSDYAIGMRSSSVALNLGQVSFGSSRHLANNFTTRGSTLGFTYGATTLSVGALSGSSQVGWDDLTGLERPTDRVFGAAIGREVFAAHPGVLRFDVNVLDGSKQPRPAFTQSAVVDAEQSEGGSMQLSAALPNQRLRLTGGYTRSHFENPARDGQLLGGVVTRRPAPVTRGARFVEASAVVLQTTNVPVIGAANLTIGVRDERVDPLFRSVAAQTNADRQQDAADATLSLGAITAQFSQSRSRDNLGRVQSILTTLGDISTATIAVPIAQLTGVHSHATLLPVFTIALNRTHQFADGVPVNGAFRPTDLPDQVSSVGDFAAQWQIGQMRLSLRANQANQDNRQDTRQNADFDSGVRAISLGAPIGTIGDVSVDAGDEFQTARERDETTRVRRFTLNGSFHPRAATNLIGAVSVVRNRPQTGVAALNTEQRVELSQGFNLWPEAAGAQRGQLFLRYARTGSLLPDVSVLGVTNPALVHRAQWTIASGLNLRLF
jgi:hypothetical protein